MKKGGGKLYKAVARETENGYSLKSLVAASRVEACRRD